MNFKNILWILLSVIIIVALVLVVKTYLYPFKKVDSTGTFTPKEISLSETSIQRLTGGIRIPTISNINYENTNFKPFQEFKAYLAQAYPNVYKAMDTLTINNYGLVFHWKGKNPNLKPILLLSHYDVVPVTGYDPETDTLKSPVIFRPKDPVADPITNNKTTWDQHPFSAAVLNGRMYGRGTLDMKGMLFSIMEAADQLLSEGFQPEQDIWFAFGQDEEVSGGQGAIPISQYFKSKGLHFDAVYDEGGIIAAPHSALEAVSSPVALVGVGEKGFLTLTIKVKGTGGHSSMPPAKSSLVYAAEIIEKLNSNQMPARIIDPIQSFFTNIGGEMGFMSRMAISNQWLLKPVLLNSLSKSPASNALIRTTTAISMTKGSDAPNVLSSIAEVTVNFRILPGSSIAEVKEHVEKLCNGYDVEIETVSAREPSHISPENTPGFEKIKKAVSKLYPGSVVTSYITIGGTDAYKYQGVSDNIYRFMPIVLNQYEQRTIHNENEYISLQNYARMIEYFKEIMKP